VKEVSLPPLPAPQLRWHWSIAAAWAFFGNAWLQGVNARGGLGTHCVSRPSACSPESVNFIDRWVLSYPFSPFLDSVSFYTQDAAALLYLAIAVWVGIQSDAGKKLLNGFLWICFGVTAALINGFLTEMARHLGQRPRPFVYLAPEDMGMNPQNYVSFYSGHTSFAAVMSMAAYLVVINHPSSKPWMRRLTAALGLTFTFLTGLFRVLSGRHFVTDVLSGATAGVLVAFLVYQHFPRAQPQQAS
jgi:membrane-associated phospholipid phosphatase